MNQSSVAAFATAVLLAALVALVALPARAAEPAEGEADGAPAPSLTDFNKKLSNPVSELWSITFQQNNFRLKYQLPDNAGELLRGETSDGDRWSSNLLFQPVLPVAISPEWNLITRPVIPLFVSQPHPNPAQSDPFHIDRTVAFGDTIFLNLVSPSEKLVGKWLLGLGPTWIFPSAASDYTGAGKWQVGPSAIVGYLAEKWILAGFVQQWNSFAGDGDRASTSSMNLQPVAAYFLPNGWSIGYSGNVLANWKAKDGDGVWTVPVGLAVGKVLKLGKLPVKVQLAAQYMPVHPDQFGQKWNIQLLFAPVLPKLVKGNLSEPSSLQFGLGR